MYTMQMYSTPPSEKGVPRELVTHILLKLYIIIYMVIVNKLIKIIGKPELFYNN